MAQLPSALSSIVNSLRGVDRSTSSFRQAANDNSKSMNKIVKDVVTMTSSQRREITNLKNSIDDVVDSNKDNASRINSTNSILEQSISLQKDMLSELRVIKRIFLQSSGDGGGIGGAAGNAGGRSSRLASALNMLSGLGGAALGALGAGSVFSTAEKAFQTPTGIPGGIRIPGAFGDINQPDSAGSRSSGGGASRSGANLSDASKKTVSDLVKLAREAGFNEREAPIMAAIAMGESSGNPKAFNPRGRDLSYGLWQINMLGNMGPERRRLFGIEYNDELYDPKVNAKAAYQIYKKQGFRAWSVYTNKSFEKWLPAAEQAARTNSGQSQTPSTNAAQGQAIGSAQRAMEGAQQSANPVDTTAQQNPQNQTSSPSPSGSSSARAADTERTGKDAQRTGGSSAIPSNDIVALGKYLQSQGIRVSEHPEFGGVGKHVPGSAHYSGRAIDINMGYGVREADHPEHGPKFDALAKQLRDAGYKVIWRQPGHEGHMHVQVGGGEGSMYQPSEAAGRRRASAAAMSSPMGEVMNQTGMALGQLSSMGMMGGRGYSGMGVNPLSSLLGGSLGFGMGMPGMGMGMGGGLIGLAGMAGQFLGNIFGGGAAPRPQFAGAAQGETEVRPERTAASSATPDFSKAPTPPPRPKITPVDTTASPLSAVASEMQKLSDTAMLQRVQSPTSDKPVEPQPYNIAAMGPQYAGYNDPIRANENMFDSWIKEISAEGKTKFKVPTSYIA